MDDLAEWLRAQLDEDERIARVASHVLRDGAHWSLDEWHGREQPHSLIAQGTAEQPVALGHFTADPVPTEQALHIAAWDPARVLAEIDVKKRLARRVHKRRRAPDWDEPGVIGFECMQCCDGPWPCQTLRLIALPYAGREGYRPEWAPTD